MYAARQSLSLIVIASVVALVLACGPGEEPTPTSTATATATATATLAPGVTPVATPTTTSTTTPTPTPTAKVEEPQRGGIIRYVHDAYPPSFDAQFLSVKIGYNHWNSPLYNNLLANYEGDTIECDLCSEWGLEDNGKTMVFKLIPGIKFHNGKEMTSADVAYSLNMIMGGIDGIASPRSGALKEYVDDIETPGKYEVKIKMPRPASFVAKLLAITNSVIYPEGTTRDDLASAPAGSGPFMLDSAVVGASQKLKANPNYFKPGLPYLDGVEVTFIGDTTARYAAFLTKKVNVSPRSAPTSTSAEIRASLEDLVTKGQAGYGRFDGGCGWSGVFMVGSKPPTDNLQLRQAINLAIDREAVARVVGYPLENVLVNTGTEFGLPAEKIWNVRPGWGTGAKKQEEIEHARQLVQGLYPDGLDMLQLGRSEGWTYATRTNSEEVQRELKRVGINTTFELYPVAVHSQKMLKSDYNLHAYQYCYTTYDADEVMATHWLTGAPRNNFDYSNPEVDRLFITMSSELDPVKRKEIFNQIRDIITLQDVAYVSEPHEWGDLWWWSNVHYTIGFSQFSKGPLTQDRVWIER